MAEEGSPAARLEDPIAHTNAHARFWAKFAGGLIGGIVVGALAGAAVVAVIGTGGAAAPLLAAAAVGGARLVGGFAGSMAGDFIADKLVPEKLTVTGKISTASMDVFINSKARGAARASPDVPIDQVLCSKHSPPIYLAEGSETVYVNSWVMSRKDDHTTCGAKISEGSPDVFVGGPTARVRDVADEVPLISKIIVTAINVAFIVRGLSCLPKLAGQGRTAIPCLVEGAVGVGVGLWGLVSSFGNPIHAATGGKILGGEAELDFELPGPIALTWQRFYSSHDVRPDGLHGQGWSVPYNVALHLGINPADEAVAVLYDRQGRDIEFPRPEPGTGIYSQSEGYWLWCSDGGRYIVQTIDGQYWVFEPAVEGAPAQRLKLQRIEDGNANYIELRYQEQRLHQLTDSTGRLLQLRCDSLGRLVEIGIVTPAPGELPGVLARYRYDGAGQLAEVIDREGRTKRRFAYNADRHMTWHANAAGLECHYEWQGSGQWARVVRHWTNDGQRYDIRYEQQEVAQTPDPNRVQGRTIVTDQMGRVQTWLWNAEYRILSYTNPLGQSWSATYDDNKQRLSLTAPNGSVTRYRYGELGLLEAETDPLGRTWSTGWLSMGLPWRETAPDGGTQLYAWDERGNLTRHTAPDGSVTRYSRDKRGLPLRIIDAKGGTKRLRWSERAQLLQYTDCSEQSTHYEWDGWGNLKSVTDALGQKTEYTHDVRGRLRAASLPDGAHYQYGYNDAGQLASISDPLSRATRLNWNRRGQLTSRQDAQQRHIALAYDQAQRLSQLVNENNATFDFSYDAANRLTEEKRPGGQRVSLEHDANGWPIAVTQHPGIGDDIQAWQANETQPPEHRIWGNEAGSSQSLRTELIRDAARRLTEKRTAQYHSRYQYDAANRLLKASRFKVLGQKEQEGKPVEFELQLLHTVSYCYDKLGNCIKEITTDEQSGQSHTLKHSHDELGNRTQTVLPALPGQEDIERALNYLHYGSGHLHQIEFSKRDTQKPDEPAQRQTISDIERDNLHRETLRTQGAATTRYAWDPVGRRIGAWSQGSNVPTQPFGPKDSGAPVWQKAVLAVGTPEHNPLDGLMKAYAYDKTGELRHSLHSLHGNAAYQYDTTGRINQRVSEDFSGGIGTEVFGYDPAGNIQDSATRLAAERATAGSQRGYVKDNLVRVFEDKRFYYDGHGRLIKKLTARHTVQLF
ncbi:MAG: DUF6531 domain-containing protein, partial [Propionibacteriaceae bacterium]|nr:DUF6531 domain-containing protein [Propionibacteriaceae bacterium]